MGMIRLKTNVSVELSSRHKNKIEKLLIVDFSTVDFLLFKASCRFHDIGPVKNRLSQIKTRKTNN